MQWTGLFVMVNTEDSYSGVYRNLQRGGALGVWRLAPAGSRGSALVEAEGERSPLKLEGFQ